MLWGDLRAALGQRINGDGIVSSLVVLLKDHSLLLPHIAVPDIRFIDWTDLHTRGFKGVVLDKDNTITPPYSSTPTAHLQSSIDQCKSIFGNNIAVLSNSAGLYEYDPDGSAASALETAIGIHVIRHLQKKPGGTAEELERHFGCKSSQLIMVGDRPMTDVAFGNRNGLLTILVVEPLGTAGESFMVRQVRNLEMWLVNFWTSRGMKPIHHSLLPEASPCCTVT